MNISELKKKYKEKRFIEAEELGDSGYIKVKNIDDLMSLCDTFFYTEDCYTGEDAIRFVIDGVFNFLSDELDDEDDLLDDVKDKYYDELHKLSDCGDIHIMSLKSADSSVGYCESSIPMSDGQNYKLVNFIVDKYNEIMFSKNSENEEHIKEVEDYIMSKKGEYLSLDDSEKERYTSNLRYEALKRFSDIRYIVESEFTDDYIRYLLDNTVGE